MLFYQFFLINIILLLMSKYPFDSYKPNEKLSNDQKWHPSPLNPYPNRFTQAPSPNHQILVYFNGKPQLQTLSPTQGPVSFASREISTNPQNSWERKHTIYPKNNAIVYPTTHSIPGPYLRSYIMLPKKTYMY
ncbi:hypothetical protein QLL95_gp1220 [Cotonvirus japonicus]|uniref:Uncharacterized protein n=1 Tax=Cotonvirus japonicus TaxID=2811091 RepID=A0ABM7NRW3_9VIRU|nr:hypothetical protein QLL95_gp1220 [Cotonvirus japonicus]BCS82903.1 hypothetical protein [Cotonvirus japonicus]